LVLVLLNRQLLQINASKLIAFCTATLIIALIESPQRLTIGLVMLGIMTLVILQKRVTLAKRYCRVFNEWYKLKHNKMM
ncbi:MAG: hypothetical protein LUQ18_01540, partial [Methylococcaceae bacterium]|nr:hypothetical protein [Methylococcaceae bacterium]